MSDQHFPPAFRLRSKQDFAAMRQGKRMQSGGLRLIYRPNALGHARIGFAVSRKYGNSVARHRLKRHLREAFRQHTLRHTSVDLMIIPLANEPALFQAGNKVQAKASEIFTRLQARF